MFELLIKVASILGFEIIHKVLAIQVDIWFPSSIFPCLLDHMTTL
jgi:hypothetical protein